MRASITGFADGDVSLGHKPYEGTRAELYGEHKYEHGRVAQVMGAAALRNAQKDKTPIYDFQTIAARYAIDPLGPMKPFLNTRSQFALTSHTLAFQREVVLQAQKPFETVMEYGACMISRSLVQDQITTHMQSKNGFVFAPLMRNHFLNAYLMEEYDRLLGPEAARQAMGRAYMPREDGVAAATDSYVQLCDAFDAPTETADLILLRETDHLSSEDFDMGIQYAPRLLKQGGAFVMALYSGRQQCDNVRQDMLYDQLISAGFEESRIVQQQMDKQESARILVAHT